METFFALLAICAGNSPVTGEFPAQRPVTRSIDVFFDLRQKQQLSKQRRHRWCETPSRSLWRHCNDIVKIRRAYRWLGLNSPHKSQWRGTMFSLICAGINCWVNNPEAGDLRRHRTRYEVIVMCDWRVLWKTACNSVNNSKYHETSSSFDIKSPRELLWHHCDGCPGDARRERKPAMLLILVEFLEHVDFSTKRVNARLLVR